MFLVGNMDGRPIARSTAPRLALVCRSLEARKPQGLGDAQRTDRAALV